MTDCIFCKIIKGDIKQDIIYEDKNAVVFLDIAPASPKGGHCLVVPKKHYELFSEIPEKEVEGIAKALQKTTRALMKFGEGVNIVQNNKRIAGQYVPHVHFHVIPRFHGDGVTISEKWAVSKYRDGEMADVAKRIRGLFEK